MKLSLFPGDADWRQPDKQSALLLAFLLPGLILADLIYGSLYLAGYEPWVSPGQLTRGAVLAAAGVLLLINRTLLFSKLGYTLLGLGILVVISIAMSPFFPENIRFDLGAAVRVLYGPFTVVLFITLFRHYRTDFRQLMFFIEIIFYFIGIALFLMSTFELGRETYGSYAFGFIGLFKAQNDTGLTATIALAAALYGFLTGPKLVRLPLLFVAMAGLTGVGTRTAMASTLVVALAMAAVFLACELLRFRSGKDLARLTVNLGVMLVMAGVTSLYAYGVATGRHFLPIPQSATQVDEQPTEYQLMKMERTMKGEAHRKDMLDRGIQHTSRRDVIYDWFGEGAWSYRAGVTRYWPDTFETEKDKLRYAEMDWFDFYGQFGLLFTGILHAFYLYFLLFSLVRLLATRHPGYGTCAIMLGVYVAHSLIAGHAMNSPMVSTQIAAVIGFLYLLGTGERTTLTESADGQTDAG